MSEQLPGVTTCRKHGWTGDSRWQCPGCEIDERGVLSREDMMRAAQHRRRR